MALPCNCRSKRLSSRPPTALPRVISASCGWVGVVGRLAFVYRRQLFRSPLEWRNGEIAATDHGNFFSSDQVAASRPFSCREGNCLQVVWPRRSSHNFGVHERDTGIWSSHFYCILVRIAEKIIFYFPGMMVTEDIYIFIGNTFSIFFLNVNTICFLREVNISPRTLGIRCHSEVELKQTHISHLGNRSNKISLILLQIRKNRAIKIERDSANFAEVLEPDEFHFNNARSNRKDGQQIICNEEKRSQGIEYNSVSFRFFWSIAAFTIALSFSFHVSSAKWI